MPIVKYIKGVSSASPTPTPELVVVNLDDILTLATAKEQLRITGSAADAVVTTAIRSGVGFVKDAADVTLAEIAASDTLRQAVIVAMRHFFNGYEEIPPLSAIWSLIDAGAPMLKADLCVDCSQPHSGKNGAVPV